ncbi:MAG: PH domain-containing protein [Isosphaeraceae bacterium]|nr:PH domain-containing protein [Isosphaeraceae bacterium]
MRERFARGADTAACLRRVVFALALLLAPAAARGSLFGPTHFEVSSQGVTIQGDLYGRFLPASSLQVPLARLVDLDQEPGYRPWIKINGVGLPSYHSGWFRLRNREKALIFLTRTNVAVYVPTTSGYAVLITPERPAEFLATLQQPAAGPAVFRIAGR